MRRLRRYARARQLAFDMDKAKGKGSHYAVRVGERLTTIQSGELTPFHVARICKQLGIEPTDL